MKLILLPVIIAALLILGGGGYFLVRNIQSPEPSPPPPAPAATQPPPAKTAPEPTPPSFEDKVTDFSQAVAEVAATGESREVTLTFTEAEVNEQAGKIMTQMEIPADIPLEIKGVSIDLQPGNNLLTVADTTILGFSAKLKVNTGVSIREGRPDISINDISFGMIPVPGTVKDKIVALIGQQTDRMLVALTEAGTGGGVDFEFIDITIDEDMLRVTVLISKTE
ncbi:MAG: hypothetical protein IIB13_03595 [Chloroflexi bacterium]|nr:hypothetical protein [Chloroflexota bacterium]